MYTIVRPLAILSLAGAMQWGTIGFAVAQNYAAPHPPIPGATPPSYSGPGWGPEEEAPTTAPATAAPEGLPVLYVTSVEILRASAEPELDIVRVTGLVSSEGWSEPELVPTYAGKPSDGVLDLELIATPPEHSENADGFVHISAILPLEPGQPLKGVRVRGSENAIAVKQVPGSGQVAIRVNDCASCIGKKLVPEGSSLQSQQDAVRQEDLPKLLRVVKASDGIRGTEHDPNRLTLMLDDDNTILEAFWE
jgi:hypothetical protein